MSMPSYPTGTLPDEPRRPLVLAGMTVAFFLFFFGSAILSQLLKPAHLSEETILFISRIFFWLCALAIYAYALTVEKQPLLLWTEKKYSFLYYLLSILAIFAVLLGGMAIIGGIEQSLGLLKKSEKLNSMVSILHRNPWLLVFTCLTAGITEELIFRGYLIPRLQLFFKNPYFSLILSSVLFGVAHIGYGNVAQIIGPLYIGFIFALYYQKYRNIKVLMICHFLWDYVSLLILTR